MLPSPFHAQPHPHPPRFVPVTVVLSATAPEPAVAAGISCNSIQSTSGVDETDSECASHACCSRLCAEMRPPQNDLPVEENAAGHGIAWEWAGVVHVFGFPTIGSTRQGGYKLRLGFQKCNMENANCLV